MIFVRRQCWPTISAYFYRSCVSILEPPPQVLTAIFKKNRDNTALPWLRSFTCSGKEHLGITYTGFHQPNVLPAKSNTTVKTLKET